MKTITYINYEQLNLVSSFILDKKEEFSEFNKLGWNYNNIKNHLKKNNNFSIGYFLNNKLSGMLLGEKIINGNNFDLEIHIIFVSKHMRNKNIGSQILGFIESHKNSTNISKIFLEVSENNLNAIKFYEKNNFVFFNFRHNYYKYNNNNFRAKCYFKEI